MIDHYAIGAEGPKDQSWPFKSDVIQTDTKNLAQQSTDLMPIKEKKVKVNNYRLHLPDANISHEHNREN